MELHRGASVKKDRTRWSRRDRKERKRRYAMKESGRSARLLKNLQERRTGSTSKVKKPDRSSAKG